MTNATKKITEITIEELEKGWDKTVEKLKEEQLKDSLKNKILKTIDQLVTNIEIFEKEAKKISPKEGITPQQQRLNLKRDLIYKKFFILQNLINAYEGQQIKLTYVHTDSKGRKEIRLYNNTAGDLIAQAALSKSGKKYHKLTYAMSEHYTKLKNALPEETNEHLQSTAKEVENRYYSNIKHIVFWQIMGQKLMGYRFLNKGPINEAFVNFYLNTPIGVDYFNKGTEENVATYIMHSRFGAIAADTQNGFLVGDVSREGVKGIQYAVKGDFASPQNFAAVKKAFQHLKQDASHADLASAIATFREQASKRARSLIRETTEEELTNMINEIKSSAKSPYSGRFS